MSRHRLGLLLLAILLAPGAALASEFSSASTSGAIAVREGLGARALGMGEAFTAIADDATCLYWNPAGLYLNPGRQMDLCHEAGFDNSFIDQVVYTQNLGTVGIGAGLVWLRGGDMALDQPDGSVSMVQSESDFIGIVGLGMPMLKNLSLGLNVKFLDTTLAESVSAKAVMTDFGVLMDLGNNFVTGFTLQNEGINVNYKTLPDALPVTVRMALSYHLDLFERLKGVYDAEIVKINDNAMALHLGAEYAYARILYLRLGYKLGYDEENSTVGFGLRWDGFALDYSLGLLNSSPSIKKLSLAVRW
jgi:hypothetical protein